MSGCGPPSEIGQAEVIAAREAHRKANPIFTSIFTPLEEIDAPITGAVSQQEDPVLLQYESLPDEDLVNVANELGVKVDKRWSRETLLTKIIGASNGKSTAI